MTAIEDEMNGCSSEAATFESANQMIVQMAASKHRDDVMKDELTYKSLI